MSASGFKEGTQGGAGRAGQPGAPAGEPSGTAAWGSPALPALRLQKASGVFFFFFLEEGSEDKIL